MEHQVLQCCLVDHTEVWTKALVSWEVCENREQNSFVPSRRHLPILQNMTEKTTQEVLTAGLHALAWNKIWTEGIPHDHVRELQSCIPITKSFEITTHATSLLLGGFAAFPICILLVWLLWGCIQAGGYCAPGRASEELERWAYPMVSIFSDFRTFKKTQHWRNFPFFSKHRNTRRKERGQVISLLSLLASEVGSQETYVGAFSENWIRWCVHWP